MPDLVIIAYDSEDEAEAARRRLFELQREDHVELGDAAVAVREADGMLKLDQLVNMTGPRAAFGGLWGALAGVVFLNSLLASEDGQLADHFAEFGLEEEFLREAAAALPPGRAALCLMVRKISADALLPKIAQFGGRLLRASLTNEEERRLRAAAGAD